VSCNLQRIPCFLVFVLLVLFVFAYTHKNIVVDTGWPSDTSASRPPSTPRGPMTRARAKAIHDKVNSLLNILDLEHTLAGSLPHCNVICAVRYEPHGATTKVKEYEEEAWKHRKKSRHKRRTS
jgi:hypothetical protein